MQRSYKMLPKVANFHHKITRHSKKKVKCDTLLLQVIGTSFEGY